MDVATTIKKYVLTRHRNRRILRFMDTTTTKQEEHTRPWADDEFIIVNGRRFVFTRSPNGPIVRFPGGKFEFAADLILRGVAVVMPKRERTNR